MSIAHPFILGQYYGAPTSGGSVLQVSQGGVLSIAITSSVLDSVALDDYTKLGFVWGGNCILTKGYGFDGAHGWIAYNPARDEFDHIVARHADGTTRMIPFGEHVAVNSGAIKLTRGRSPFDTSASGIAVANYFWHDSVILGQDIHAIRHNTFAFQWGYPFNSAAAQFTVNIHRLAVFKGEVFGVYIIAAGTCWLRKFTGAGWADIGTGFTLTNQATVRSDATQISLFEYNGTLYLITLHGAGGTNKIRCYSLDTTLGTATEHSGFVYAGWQIGGTSNDERLFEIIDDVGSSRKVYLVRAGFRGIGGFDVCEFLESAWPLDTSGGNTIYPYCGVLWSKTGQGARIAEAQDSSPSSYVSTQMAVADLSAGGAVDIDPRYRLVSDLASGPPFAACSEKNGVGSEGKIGLLSKPSTIGIVDNLSDDFDDGVINEDLWEKVYLRSDVTAPGRDYGFGSYATEPIYFPDEAAGLFFPGSPADVVVQNIGAGIRSKWWVNGNFQFDVKVQNFVNLRADASRRYWIGMLVRMAVGRAYLLRVFDTGAGPKARGGFIDLGGNWTESADSTTPVTDGMKLRIARTGGVFAVTLDPDGAAESLKPGGAIDYADAVQVALLGMTHLTLSWLIGTPPPAFDDFEAGGIGGTLVKYEGEVKHLFAWDHVADEGAGVNDTAELYVDGE